MIGSFKNDVSYETLVDIAEVKISELNATLIKEFVENFNNLLRNHNFNKKEYLFGLYCIGKVSMYMKMKNIDSFYQGKCHSAMKMCINELERQYILN